jgi:hypothetical protein
MKRTFEARVSDWVTGIVFPWMSVSVKRDNKLPAVPIHVMRRDDARLRKRQSGFVAPKSALQLA